MPKKKRPKIGEPLDVDGIIARSNEARHQGAIESDPWGDRFYRTRASTVASEADRPIPTVGFNHNPDISARARKARRAAAASGGRKTTKAANAGKK